MDIDIYQQCPCLSGKKIKFCCGKNVVTELNSILTKSSRGQMRSALDLIERTVEKHGPLDCMLTIKTHLLITEGETEEAQVANDEFRKKNPGHTTGFHHQALIHLSNRDVPAAVESLQDAMDSITGNEIPISLSNAFRMIGVGLLATGKVVGARAHLQYAQLLKDQPDKELQQMMFQTFRAQEISMLLKQDFRLQPVVEGAEWEKRYTNTVRAMDRGQFRKGLEFLEKIQAKHPDQPQVMRGIAMLNMYLGRSVEAGKAWHAYSICPGIREWEQIEAAALSQMFAEEPLSELIDINRVSYTINDMEKASESALSSDRLVSAGEAEVDPFEEGPAPRHVFYLLDKPKVESADDISLENVPKVAGEILIYGKQTDREARVEWVSAKNAQYETTKAGVEEIFRGLVDGDAAESKIGDTTEVADLLGWNWHLPQGISREKHSSMVDQHREDCLLKEWVKLKFAPLGNKSPEEVAGDENYKIPLSALLLHLEQSDSSQLSDHDAITKLRDQVKVGQLPICSPDDADPLLSPIQQQYLDFKALTDEQLLGTQSEAMAIGNLRVLKKAVPEVLKREHLDEKIPRDVSLSMMANLTEDSEQALDYLNQARNAAKQAGRSVGVYMVQEFELRLSRGLTEKLPELLTTIQRRYLDDPQVEMQLAMVLQKYGLMDEQGRMVGQPRQAAPVAAAAPAEQGIWTPEGESAEPAAPASDGDGDGNSGLWIPD